MTTVPPVLSDGEQLARREGQHELADALAAARRRLGEPMRVAVAGQIKRGKSTLVNALLGEDVAPTAQLEATFTVSEFHRAPQRGVVVRYVDPARPPHPVGIEEFRRFTVRDPAQLDLLRGVERVEYGLTNPLLDTFRLVDTPGLGSVYVHDADNAAAFLGIDGLDPAEQDRVRTGLNDLGRTAGEVHRDSAAALAGADAVVYLFDRAAGERDLAAVSAFLGPLAPGMNALKAFGVLSRCDETFWPPGPDQPGDPDPLTWDPIATAERIVEGYLDRPESRRTFYTIVPVAGLVGLAARTLSGDDWDALDGLAALDPPRLSMLLEDAGYFAGAATLPGVGLPPGRRTDLIRRLGAWGCLRAACYLRDGLDADKVADQLVADSGVGRLRDTISGHFGNRAELIKLDSGLGDVSAVIDRLRLQAQRDGRRPDDVVGTVASRIEEVRTRTLGFAQLDALSAYYNGEVDDLGASEVAELLRLTGEDGTSVPARLGAAPDTALSELEAIAGTRVDVWARRLAEGVLDGAALTAARVALRTCERLADRVRTARVLLETDRDVEGRG